MHWAMLVAAEKGSALHEFEFSEESYGGMLGDEILSVEAEAPYAVKMVIEAGWRPAGGFFSNGEELYALYFKEEG